MSAALDKDGRAADELLLAKLHAVETCPTAQVRAEFGMSNSAVQGLKVRFRTEAKLAECLCEKPENKDGGMPDLWWQT